MNKKLKLAAIVGARPQFIKHYPFEKEAIKHFDLITIHTGQHYDDNMSKVFFDQLGMRKPDYQLSLGGGSHGAQTGRMLIEIEQVVIKEKPDMMVVYGDTNSTLAGALVAGKLRIPIVHIEAGLRSYNKEMPEELNRIMTDHLSDLLLVPSEKSVDNLKIEGILNGVHIVGDIMKDLVLMAIKDNTVIERVIQDEYYYATLHRPYNVDEKERLEIVLSALQKMDRKVVFAAHPRTQNKIKNFGLEYFLKEEGNIHIVDPQPYFENLSFLYHSEGLITDSGGMQKEAYWLEKRCITIRKETEWIETCKESANVLVFENLDEDLHFNNSKIDFDKSLYGDGNSAKLICEYILKLHKK